MNKPQKYYEELFFSSGDDRQLLPQNQDAIIELLDKNGAVGVLGVYDEPDFPIYFISGFALTAIDYTYDEMMAATEGKFINLVFEKDRQMFLDAAVDKTLHNHEFRMVSKSGKNVWVSSYRRDSVSMDGRPIVVASIRVIENARKRESELLDALTRGYSRIIYVDVNRGRYRIIKNEVNGTFEEQVCGTVEELEELLQQYGKDYINPEDHSFAEMLNKLNYFANPGDKGGNYQATYRAKVNGNYQWVQFQAFYGGVMHLDTGHFILAFRVVDEEKRRELDTNQLLSDSLKKAEQAGRVKNQFLSRMSHDLRTPINGIIGMIEIAKQNTGNRQKMEECLDKISTSCEDLMSLVQDLLDMNNLENGIVEMGSEPFNLNTFFAEEMSHIAARAEKGGLTFQVEMENFAHPNIIGSPQYFRQIFEHILDNSIKYNKPNGSIVLSGREISHNETIATYEFCVEDTGLGMAEEFIANIFEPFEQEHNEARTKYMGAGLGMSIVKKLVEQMNGTVTVTSRIGEGSKVIVTLPFTMSEKTEEPSAENINLIGLSVLLVEDNELNMEIARFLLESAGMVVTGASNGQEAIEIFESSGVDRFQVILMDILMPVMDGLEASKRIRKLNRPDALTVPIIALSANVMDSDIKKTKMAGMNEHLSKPINSDQLLSSIAKCLVKKERALL